MKRSIVIVAVMAMGVGVLLMLGCPQQREGVEPSAGEGGMNVPGGEAGEAKELTMYTIWNAEPRRSALDDIVAGFEEENPDIDIKLSNLEPDQYKTKIRVALGGDNPPDIYFVWSGEKMLHNFVRGGNCLDITKYLDEDGGKWRERIVETSLQPYIYDGKAYGVPYLLQCTFFFYNKEIFDEHDISIPQTWSELLEVCEKLKRADVTPIALGNKEKWPAHHFPCVLFQRLMGHEAVMEQYDPLGPGEYSDPGWLQGLRMFDRFQRMGFFNPSPNGLSRADARAMFYGGRAAMFYTGTWDFGQLSKGGEAPERFWDKWDFFNFPAVKGGEGDQDALAGSADGYVISSETEHPEAAVEFLKYMTSPPVAYEFVDKCKELVQVKGAVDEDNASWYLQKYADIVADADTISAWTDTMMERSVAEVFMNGIQGMLAGEKTPEQILEAVRERQVEVKENLEATQEAG